MLRYPISLWCYDMNVNRESGGSSLLDLHRTQPVQSPRLPSAPESLAPVPSLRGDPLLRALALLCLASFALVAPFLVYSDLNLDYPFVDGDSHDWIANGLRLAGHDVRYSGRPPLLPLAIALLDRLGALRWLPVLLQLLFHGTVLAFYRLAARLHPRRAAFAASLLLLACHSLRLLSLQVMADLPAACLLFFALRAFVLAGERPRLYVAGGLFAGLAALTQTVGVLWLPAALAALLGGRRRDLRSRWWWAGVALLLAPQAAWAAAKLLAFGTAGDVLVRYGQFLRLHAGSFPFYLSALVSLLGLPACLLLVAGAALALRRPGDASRSFAPALAATLLVFFVFCYDYDAKRFLAYLAWPAGLLVAAALARCRGRLFFAAAGLAVLAAALPLPDEGNDASWAALWPLPPVYAHAAIAAAPSGSARLDPARIAIATVAPARLAGLAQPLRVWRARAAGPGPGDRLDPALVRGDRAAIYLFDGPGDGGRYRTLTRLSAALRRRVKVLPGAHFSPYWDLLAVSRAGAIAPDYAIYRARLPGLADSWLLVAAPGGPLAARLDRLATGAPLLPPPAGEALAAGRERAAAIRRFVDGDDAYVLLVPGRRADDLSQLYLPFLLDSTELLIPQPGREEEMLGLVAADPVLAERRFGGALVRKIQLFGRRSTLISYR
jgi:4-amino-4-deoxy-L-arabinose transferase-like glycosyltransferase